MRQCMRSTVYDIVPEHSHTSRRYHPAGVLVTRIHKKTSVDFGGNVWCADHFRFAAVVAADGVRQFRQIPLLWPWFAITRFR
jgi:hypothetical protein